MHFQYNKMRMPGEEPIVTAFYSASLLGLFLSHETLFMFQLFSDACNSSNLYIIINQRYNKKGDSSLSPKF